MAVVHRRRDGVAFAGDQRRCDRSFVAGQDRADALVDGLAHAIHGRGVAQPQTGRVRRLGGADAAEHEARGADTLEIYGDLRGYKHLGCVNDTDRHRSSARGHPPGGRGTLLGVGLAGFLANASTLPVRQSRKRTHWR
jgi:hypothetical protein